MSVYLLGDEIAFPSPYEAEPGGLLAVGGDLSPERLLLAYSMGIFPWYGEDEPILWYAPAPRMVLEPSGLHISRSLRRRLGEARFRVTLDRAFDAVIRACAEAPRPGQPGTWITGDMIVAYDRLHGLGYAHSVEVWDGDDLVGGLYGVSIGACFCGESMFARVSDASKVGFVALVRQLGAWGIDLIDCQLPTAHLRRLGGVVWGRRRFLDALGRASTRPTRRGPWAFDGDCTVPDLGLDD